MMLKDSAVCVSCIRIFKSSALPVTGSSVDTTLRKLPARHLFRTSCRRSAIQAVLCACREGRRRLLCAMSCAPFSVIWPHVDDDGFTGKCFPFLSFPTT